MTAFAFADRVSRRTDLQDIAARLAAANVPSWPLYRAAADGEIAVIRVDDPASHLKASAMAGVARPTVIVLSGDPGWGEPTFGPGRWRCAKVAREWAGSAIVHGAGGEPGHYATAVMMVQVSHRLVLIETTSALVNAWRAFLHPVPMICIVPPDGGVHPVPPEVRH